MDYRIGGWTVDEWRRKRDHERLLSTEGQAELKRLVREALREALAGKEVE